MGAESLAWKINVTATENIIENCKKLGKKLLYVDTDYAFDGKKKLYTEEDAPHPLGWYGITKYEGAKRVLALGGNGLVMRIANPYRAHPVGKKDFVHKMMERLQSGQDVVGATDQVFVPTFIDDIARAVRALIKASASGIYHVVGSTALSPYEAAGTIAKVLQLDTSHIKPTTFHAMFQDRAPVPQFAALTNAKLSSLGVSMYTFEEGLKEMKKQEQEEKQ